jgi:AcrR family transcriptional regulator
MKLTKKEQIEQKAKELFWKHGFKKVTIDEICKKANVSRKTFYTFYENKNALVLYILNETIETMKSENMKVMAADISFGEKMKIMLDRKLKFSETISLEFIADLYSPDGGDVRDFFQDFMKESVEISREFFRQAQEKGEMNPHLNIDFVMWIIQKLGDFCSNQELIALFPDAESMTRQLAEYSLYGIMPVK